MRLIAIKALAPHARDDYELVVEHRFLFSTWVKTYRGSCTVFHSYPDGSRAGTMVEATLSDWVEAQRMWEHDNADRDRLKDEAWSSESFFLRHMKKSTDPQMRDIAESYPTTPASPVSHAATCPRCGGIGPEHRGDTVFEKGQWGTPCTHAWHDTPPAEAEEPAPHPIAERNAALYGPLHEEPAPPEAAPRHEAQEGGERDVFVGAMLPGWSIARQGRKIPSVDEVAEVIDNHLVWTDEGTLEFGAEEMARAVLALFRGEPCAPQAPSKPGVLPSPTSGHEDDPGQSGGAEGPL